MAAALAAQPAPAPATADGIDTIAAEIRAGLREHTDLMENAVGIRFSREAARATGSLNALAALAAAPAGDEDAALRRLHAEHSKTPSKAGTSKWDVIAAAIGTRRTASAAEHRWAIIKNKNAPAAPLDVLAAASPPPTPTAPRLPAALPEAAPAPAAPRLPAAFPEAPAPSPAAPAAKKRGRDGDDFEFDGDGADAAKPKKPAVRVCKKPRASAKPTAGATEREGPIPNDGSFLETMKKRFAKARADAPAAPASPLDDSSLRGPPG